MTVLPATPTGSVLFCDDIREEGTGKGIYIGVYKEILGTFELPLFLPKFGLVIKYIEGINESDDPVTIRIFFPNEGKEKAIVEQQLPMESTRTEARKKAEADPNLSRIFITFEILLPPQMIQKEGAIIVEAFRGNDPPLELGRLPFVIVQNGDNPPSASQ